MRRQDTRRRRGRTNAGRQARLRVEWHLPPEWEDLADAIRSLAARLNKGGTVRDPERLARELLVWAINRSPQRWQKIGKARVRFRRDLLAVRAALADSAPRRGKPRSLARALARLREHAPLGPLVYGDPVEHTDSKLDSGPAQRQEAARLERAIKDMTGQERAAFRLIKRLPAEAMRKARPRLRLVAPTDPAFFRVLEPLLAGGLDGLTEDVRAVWIGVCDRLLAALPPLPPHRPVEAAKDATIRRLARLARTHTRGPLDDYTFDVFVAIYRVGSAGDARRAFAAYRVRRRALGA